MERAGQPRFGELLRRYRLDAGLTQQGLAERSHLSVEAIGLLEREGRTRPQRETVQLLIAALALSAERESLLRGALGVPHPPRRRERDRERSQALPQQRNSFVGRKRELANVATLLETAQLITLAGAGGVGKTRLALQLAARTQDHYPDGVHFADLAPLSDETLVASAVASALPLAPATGSALDAIVVHLERRHALLILDNCEHVRSQARAVAARIAEACPFVRVLATSREPLDVPAEQVFRLPSLPAPETLELFADRARAVDATFALTEDNAPHVAEICARLDGIPLAIELAAARIATLAPKQIAERLDRRFRLLTLGDANALPRQQTMRALIDWSYDLLTPRERRLFERLSVFAGGCSLDAVTAVCALEAEDDLDIADLIASLVRKSLLVAEVAGDERRYRLLESPREYAREKLLARGEAGETAQRHALAYVEVARRLEACTETTTERTWAARAERERENLRAALEWTLGTGADIPLGLRLVAERKVILRSFAPAEARRWVRTALAEVDDRTPSEVVARLEHADADGANQFGERAFSLAAAERALLRYRETGDALGSAQAQSLAGSALTLLGRTAEAEPRLREALETARALGDRRLTARVLQMLGWNGSAARDFAAARAHYTEALALAEVLGAEFIAVSIAASLADNEFEAGNLDGALEGIAAVLVALRALRSSQVEPGIAATLTNMATCLVALARYDEAQSHAEEALEAARSLRLVALATLALRVLVIAALLKPRAGEALAHGAYSSAARLFGFLEAHLTTIASEDYALQAEHDRARAVVGAALGVYELRYLLRAGATMTEEEAVTQSRSLR